MLKECTTHFDVIDAEGNAVSCTQSLGDGFGSGIMAGDTGVMLNNLAYWFDVHPDSPNVLGPRKKIEMCMSPAAVFRGDDLFLVIGTPDTVIRQIRRIQQLVGITHFNCSFWFGDVEHPRVLRSMELFAKEVMPAFL